MQYTESGIFSPLSASERRGVAWAGWSAFILSLLTYWLTVAPSASFWDCPEYILTAVRLEVGHPPGNPFWTLFHRFVTVFSGAGKAALAINLCSGLFTALAVMLLARMASMLVRRVLAIPVWGAAAAGVAGALLFGWCDSAWYSAVEAEVYAMSIFFTALTLWLMLRWALDPSGPGGARMLLLVVYLTGLSIGVHQLNLLSIPCLALIWLWRRHPGEKIGFRSLAGVLLLSMIVIALILKGMMPGTVRLACFLELFCVNTLHLPFSSGVWLSITLMAVICAAAIFFSRRHHRLHLCAWSVTLLLIGYSSLLLIPVRAAASPYINSGDPSNPFSLLAYIDREQYGGAPLLYGRTPYSRPMAMERWGEDSIPDYSRLALEPVHAVWQPAMKGARTVNRSGFISPDDSLRNLRLAASGRDAYLLSDYRYRRITTPELDMWFPRLTSGERSDIEAYRSWIGMDTASMTRVAVSDAFDSLGHPVSRVDVTGSRKQRYSYRPTYLQNLTYFLGYQAGYMYMRYLLWNFSGRQNDITSSGEADHGNLLTGIPPLDRLMTGDPELYPPYVMERNPGCNRYFMLPLLLCLFGIVVCSGASRPGRRTSFGILMLFLLTGVAIVVYLNQTVGEPRERDYSFLGSFFAFAGWGAFGCAGLIRMAISVGRRLGKRFPSLLSPAGTRLAGGAGAVMALAVPVMMLAVNYDDHDRSRRDAATDFAANILCSLEPDAILFTNGDNYTFPLWYAQEVLGIRRDVTVVSMAYLSLPSYVASLQILGEERRGVAMTAAPADILYGRYSLCRYPAVEADTMTPDIADFLRLTYGSGGDRSYLPSSKVMMNLGRDSLLLNLRDISGGTSQFPLKLLSILDIVATNGALPSPRPVYWVFHLPDNAYAGLKGITAPALFARRLIYAADSVDIAAADSRFLSRMRWGGFSLSRPPYADFTVRNQVSGQRVALIRAGRRALDAGDVRSALRFARAAADSLSVEASPMEYAPVEGLACWEGEELPRLLMEAGSLAGDSAAMVRGKELWHIWADTRRDWQRWRGSLPPHLRDAISYRTLRILNR